MHLRHNKKIPAFHQRIHFIRSMHLVVRERMKPIIIYHEKNENAE